MGERGCQIDVLLLRDDVLDPLIIQLDRPVRIIEYIVIAPVLGGIRVVPATDHRDFAVFES